VFTDGFLAGEGGRAVDPLRYYRSGMGAQDGDALNALLRFEQRYELADFQLSRVDRLTMAHSVEARVPYLDPRVVELANGIPSRFKVRGTREKDILRLAMKDLVPEVILERRKQGLGTPLIPWFGSGFREVARDLLSDSNVRARGVFDVRYVQRLFDSSKSRLLHREDLGKLFKIVMFEMWCRLFLDPTTAEYAEPEWAEFGATA
jgi:asparagine synthase (glutamine-hydrolysing)